jgi:hypothetical protein
MQFRTQDEVVELIRQGRWFDKHLDEILAAAQERKSQKRAELVQAVKDEYGPDAFIGGSGPNGAPSRA